MRHVIWKVDGEEYKLRLGVSDIMALEKRLGGRNPMDMLMMIDSGRLPSLTATLAVIQSAMTHFHHNVNIQEVNRIYERFIDKGGAYMDLIPVVMEVFEVAGFFKSNPVAVTIEKPALEETEEIKI